MTAKLSFCVKAATSLDDQDLATITQSIEHYQRAGMSAEQAESAAVGDMIAAVTAERGDMVKTLRTQHPDLFLSSRPPLPEPKKALARVQPIRGSMALGQISVQLDGLSPDLLPDLSSKVERTRVGKTGKRSQYTTWDNPSQPGVGPLFRKGGTADMSEVARVLDEEGYMEPGLSESDPRGAIKRAEAIIKAELAKGGSTMRIGAPEEVEAEMQRRQDMANDLPDDVFDGIDDDAFEQSGYADLPPEVKALTEQLLAQAEAAGLDTETMRERAAMGDPTDADYHAQLDALLTEALASAAAGAEEHDASAAPGGREGGREPAEGEEPGAGPAGRDAGRAEPGGLSYGGTVQEPGASYTTDLFGTDLEGAGATQLPTQRAAAPTPAPAPAPTATPTEGALNDTPAPEGNYQARTIVGSEIQRTLGAARITTPAEAAAATQYLYRNAVERFDGIVVDKNGKPLAVVGGFKGALAQASVYQATVMGEAIRVPGAAAIWFSHNHPSGSAQLSNADKQLNGALAKMFRGSGLESKGLLAIGDGRYHYVDEKGKEAAPWTITKLTTTSKVPVIERQLGGTKEATVGLTSPLQAKAMAKKLYEAGGDRPGLVLLDSQLNVVAWVPLPEVTQGKLRGTGGLNAIYRAVSEANAGGAMIVHGGELDVKVNGPVTAAHNIAAALRDVDVRTIDVVNAKTNTSDAEGAGVRAPSEAFSLANEDIRTDFQDTQQLERPEVTEGTPAQQDVDAIAKLEGNFKRKVEAFQSLKLTALPRRAEPAKNASQAERERYAAADMAEKLFGKRVVFFSSNIAFANGVMADYLPGMVFVNEATTRPIMAVLGHELLHSMRQSNPALYVRLHDRLRGMLEEPGRYHEQLNRRREARGMDPLSYDKLREELLADIVGDNFTDPAFWRQMTAGQPTLFGRVLRVIRDFLDDLLAKLRNERPYGTNQYLNDVQAARDAVAAAMREFGNDPKTAAAAVTTAAGADLSTSNDQTGTTAFRKWFGDSKVVNDDGTPRVVYHGTGQAMLGDAFSPDLAKSEGGAFYFSHSPLMKNPATNANDYAKNRSGDAPNVMPVYLRMTNPLIVGFTEPMPEGDKAITAWLGRMQAFNRSIDMTKEQYYKRAIREARAAGHDGVIVRNVEDVANDAGRRFTDEADVYIALKPEQIKSAIGNSGAFDPNSANISESANNDPFYSELSRQVETAKMASAPAQGWKDWLKGLTNKGTIKADEIAWTGIEDWLDLQQGKISRDAVVDFLAGNGVKVTETQSPTGESIGTQDFRTWQLPGGSNYREVLLTLPRAAPKMNYRVSSAGGAIATLPDVMDFDTREQADAELKKRETEHPTRFHNVMEYEKLARDGGNPGYTSGHWDQKNVLAHIRLNDRTDADGKRVLFVEEIQSDWAQQGKKSGFKGDMIPQNRNWQAVDTLDTVRRREVAEERLPDLQKHLERWAKDGVESRLVIKERQGLDEDDAPTTYYDIIEEQRSAVESAPRLDGVPRAPFVGKTDAWVALSIKRVIKMAVDEGYDRVAFVNGEQSAERYKLSKEVKEVSWRVRKGEKQATVSLKNGDDLTFHLTEAGAVESVEGTGERTFIGKGFDEVIGKDVAAKVMAEQDGRLSGEGLNIGGAGMKAFYAQIVPKVAKDVVKKLGGSLRGIDVEDHDRAAQARLRYVGPVPTAQEWASLDKMARGYGNEMVSPFTGKKLDYSINRVAVADQTTRIGRAMNAGQSFNDAMVEHGGDFLAEVIGGKIEPIPLAEQKRQTMPQTGFDITPSMREKAAGGLPMFSLQHTPEEEAALAKAGINTRTRLQRAGDRIRQHYTTAQNALRSEWAAGFQQGALDQFTGINRAIKREIGALPRDQDPYVAARLANGGTSSVMRGLMLHGQARWAANGQHLEKIPDTEGLLDILKPLGPRLNDFFGWMIGNRAERLMKEGRENNFTADDIKALKGLNKGMETEFRAAALKYAAFKRTVLDVAEQAGLLDPDGRKVWDNADYIPFYREIDDKAVFGATGKKGLAGQSSGIRTLKGGEAALNDPMENILMNFSRLVDASLKNRALRGTIDVLTAAKSDIVAKVGYDMNKQVVPANQVRKQLEAAGTPQQILDIIPPEAFEGMAKMWAIQAPTDPDVVRVMRNGKPEFYRVNDPLLLKALTSFIPFDFPGLGVARAFKRVLTSMVTVTPDFMLRNWIRDTAATAIITRDGFNPLKSLSGVVKSYREAGAFEDLLFAGASFQSGHINAADPVQTGKAMRRALREKGFDASSTSAFIGSILDTPMRFFEKYKHVGESIENGNREAVYEAARNSGKSATAAAFESKDLMDFSLRGSSPFYQLLADVLPFFNARVQGLYRLGRADPKRVALYGTLMMVATLALAYANGDNDDYDKLPDWDKETYWHFWIKGEHFRMPKPFELGAVFASIPERIMRYTMGQDTGKKTLSRLWAIVRDQLAFDPVPQLIRPVMNTWANKDTFRDRPIENQGDEGKLPSMRYSKVTSPTAVTAVKAIAPVADEIGLSPKKLEYLVGGYLGTAGLYALGLSDMAVSKLRGDPVKPATRLDQLPIIGSFYRQEPATSTVYETDLYKMRTEVEQIYKSVRALKKDDKDDEAEALAAKHEKELDARKTLERGAKKLTSLNKQRDEIYADRTMTREEKRKAIDELLRDRAEISKDTMKSEEVINAQ